ncbi:MAG: type III-B CRISPR module-associated Cmr3 family protein, partial [Candidatus Micrarchaeia archaeon]
FKLYLATPSCFNGWKPPSEKLKETLGVKNLRLIAALPGKPIYIGGYDFALNKEKPLQRWVNAGAVYYYTFEGTIDVNLVLPIRILEDNIDMRCAFIGRWGKCLKKP